MLIVSANWFFFKHTKMDWIKYFAVQCFLDPFFYAASAPHLVWCRNRFHVGFWDPLLGAWQFQRLTTPWCGPLKAWCSRRWDWGSWLESTAGAEVGYLAGGLLSGRLHIPKCVGSYHVPFSSQLPFVYETYSSLTQPCCFAGAISSLS